MIDTPIYEELKRALDADAEAAPDAVVAESSANQALPGSAMPADVAAGDDPAAGAS